MVRKGVFSGTAVVIWKMFYERRRSVAVLEHGHIDGDLLSPPLANVASKSRKSWVATPDGLIRVEQGARGGGGYLGIILRLCESRTTQPGKDCDAQWKCRSVFQYFIQLLPPNRQSQTLQAENIRSAHQ